MLDPESSYVAYCPPGTIEDATETLDRGGHTYSKIYEHQILEGSEQIILIDTTPIELPPLTFDEYWYTAASMRRWMSDPLIPRYQPIRPCSLIRSTD